MYAVLTDRFLTVRSRYSDGAESRKAKTGRKPEVRAEADSKVLVICDKISAKEPPEKIQYEVGRRGRGTRGPSKLPLIRGNSQNSAIENIRRAAWRIVKVLLPPGPSLSRDSRVLTKTLKFSSEQH